MNSVYASMQLLVTSWVHNKDGEVALVPDNIDRESVAGK